MRRPSITSVAATTTLLWSRVPGQQLIARSKSRDEGVRLQSAATLCGSLLLLVSLVSAAVFSYASFGSGASHGEVSDAFRAAEARLVTEQVAVILRPAWSVCRQFVDRLKAGGGQQDGYVVIPPRPDTFADPVQLLAYTKALAPYFNREVHLSSTTANFSEFEHNKFMGLTMALALDENLTVTTKEGCVSNTKATTHLNPYTLDTYYVIPTYYDSNGTGKRVNYTFDIETFELKDPQLSARSTRCSGLTRIMWGDSPQLEDFYNFTWYGPISPDLGWGSHLLGSVPIYNEMQEQVGRFSVPISMDKTIGPGLSRSIKSAEKLRGGAAALFTESRAVLGLSEAAASSSAEEQASTLDDLAFGSKTARAIEAIERSFGEPCPEGHHSLLVGQYLVEVTVFMAEDYGMPPLPERWCLLVMLPRENIFAAIDRVTTLGVYAAICCALGFAGAIASFFTSLLLAVRARSFYKAEELASDLAAIQAAEDSIDKLTSPMVIVSAEDFLAIDALECYEDWRDRGKVKWLDSIDAAKDFRRAGNLIVFISHQWLGWQAPDFGNVQLRVMQEAVEWFVANEAFPVYIWLDFICIAQRHKRAQALAVAALPVYVSLVDRFVICAPDAKHQDTEQQVGLASYNRRGWCRAEMLAKACSSGIENMFVCAGEHGSMRPFVPEDMERISLSVYEGDFTVPRDAEKLVVPILGLYSLILRRSDQIHMQRVKKYIDDQKKSFFPHSYDVEVDGEQETRKLFGNRIELLEQHVAKLRAGSKQSLASRSIIVSISRRLGAS